MKLRSGNEKEEKSISTTQEDGLKLLQYNVTKYTNLCYISCKLA